MATSHLKQTQRLNEFNPPGKSGRSALQFLLKLRALRARGCLSYPVVKKSSVTVDASQHANNDSYIRCYTPSRLLGFR